MAQLDHVVVHTGQQMDGAVSAMEALGFRLTERGHHSMGSINHLAMFRTNYLELLCASSPWLPPPAPCLCPCCCCCLLLAC